MDYGRITRHLTICGTMVKFPGINETTSFINVSSQMSSQMKMSTFLFNINKLDESLIYKGGILGGYIVVNVL